MNKKVNVFDVAKYILEKTGRMTTWKLQKLIYYCQAWSLVWDEKPLFPERIEAWSNGPVVRELYHLHKGKFLISTLRKGDPKKLNENHKEAIDAVLDYYAPKSSQWLSDLTHMEDPWKKARHGLPDNVRDSHEITLDSMMEYYSGLKEDA